MVEYTTRLAEVPNTTDFSQVILADTTKLTFHFTWATAVQEVVDEYEKALEMRRKADPLWIKGEVVREYEWIDFYTSLPHIGANELGEYLEEEDIVPDSLRGLKEQSAPLFYNQMYERCVEADNLKYLLQPYYNRLVWTVEVTDEEGNSVSGVVRRGGWLNNGSYAWSVQFEADKDIGRDDLLLVDINIEVPDE